MYVIVNTVIGLVCHQAELSRSCWSYSWSFFQHLVDKTVALSLR